MLKWDPKKYNNLKVIRLPFSSIWKPDVLLYNKLKEYFIYTISYYLHHLVLFTPSRTIYTISYYLHYLVLFTLSRTIYTILYSLHYLVLFTLPCTLYSADVSAYKSSISTNIIVSNDGNVTWLSMMIFKSSCALNVKYFPFDEQNCSLKFASWTYDGFQVCKD